MENQNTQPVTPVQDPSLNSSSIPTQTVPPTRRKSKMIYVLIILFVLLFVISAVALGMKYFNGSKKDTVLVPPSSPTPASQLDSTANWKTYTNSPQGYSLKYPEGWESGGGGFETGDFLKTKELKMTDYSNVETGAFIYGPYVPGVVDRAKSIDELTEFITKSSPDVIIVDSKSIKLDGQDAKMITAKHTDAYSIDVTFKYPVRTFETDYSFISLISDVENFEKHKAQFEQMISTFTFTNSQTTPDTTTTKCVVGGCSGQLCVAEGDDTMSTCEYAPFYACYKTATCETQSDGTCGWTQTAALTSCLENAQ